MVGPGYVQNATRLNRELDREMRAILDRPRPSPSDAPATALVLYEDPFGRFEIPWPPDWSLAASFDGLRTLLASPDLGAFAQIDLLKRFTLEDLDPYWEWVRDSGQIDLDASSPHGFHGRLSLAGRSFTLSAVWTPCPGGGALLIGGYDADIVHSAGLRHWLNAIRHGFALRP